MLAGVSRSQFAPTTPGYLRASRTCYDHIAGTLGVLLHDRLKTLGWLAPCPDSGGGGYDVTSNGVKAAEGLGVDVAAARMARRRFAFPCLDWSERRSHFGGAVEAALLKLALKRKWVIQELDSRALSITRFGRHELQDRLGL